MDVFIARMLLALPRPYEAGRSENELAPHEIDRRQAEQRAHAH